MDNDELISVEVRNPRTHLKRRWTSFTDYEIVISTNSMAFALQQSKVRRRFSEFEWLRRTLAKNSSISTTPPPLPNKRVLGRFNQDFLEKRRAALEEFLTKVINTTFHLSELAVHLFLQSSLTTKEIERVLEGKDQRDVAELILQEKKLNEKLTRKGSEHTNTDSGFSGSNNLDWHIPDCILKCQGIGNGWSSGCTNMLGSSSGKRKPCKACRRKSLRNNAASVLPTGQLLIAEDVQDSASKNDSNGSISSSERCPEENCTKCNQYDADDETDANVVDYDIINTKTFRLRDWLTNVTPANDCELDSTDEGDCNLPPSLSRSIPEYDVISVPCSSTSINNTSLRRSNNLSDDGTCGYGSSNDSQYSVVHSTIDGLKLENYNKFMCSSSSTLSSAGIYRTYDVVEMIELR
ncbi:uncharacterized protein LOC116295475 [Actinia tenebrosa]|uniref:Uncharacterized protein LOC116295475 n=1 Tax=Actinia tenebrosa TaxID=6105 RepID=A0A6P8I2S4_ACTTE|nr:uncharacterized protein LOC116295475 [Actinia tenebrosa]